MPQQPDESPDLGAAHSLIVRLRREPRSTAWRAQIIDVQSGATTVIGIAPIQGDEPVGMLSAALAAAIERLLASPPSKEV